jgi:hypothetical protein
MMATLLRQCRFAVILAIPLYNTTTGTLGLYLR